MGRLFGTDGARGVANSELTCELAMKIGRATAMVLTDSTHKRPRVLIGMDTRASSEMLEAAISAGLFSVGADVLLLGVVPTPAVAFLVQKYQYDAGIMISASHNPCEYNGIKIFKSDGYKLPDALEEEIEAIILDETVVPPVKIGGDVGRVTTSEMPIFDYITHLCSTVDYRFNNMKIALDCANGSSSITAPEFFMQMGAECDVLANEPDGVNINDNCGSTHLENLQKYVVEHGLMAGFAFDGDADRLLAVDENGDVVLAASGEVAVGITIIEDGVDDITGAESGKVAKGDDVTIQIKDIGLVKAGAAIAKGAEIASDANGCAVTATEGNFVIGTAKTAAKENEYCHIIINKYQK